VTSILAVPCEQGQWLVTSNDSRLRLVQGYGVAVKYKGHRNAATQVRGALSLGPAELVACGSDDGAVYVWQRLPPGCGGGGGAHDGGGGSSGGGGAEACANGGGGSGAAGGGGGGGTAGAAAAPQPAAQQHPQHSQQPPAQQQQHAQQQPQHGGGGGGSGSGGGGPSGGAAPGGGGGDLPTTSGGVKNPVFQAWLAHDPGVAVTGAAFLPLPLAQAPVLPPAAPDGGRRELRHAVASVSFNGQLRVHELYARP
jgi:hypothetical protein